MTWQEVFSSRDKTISCRSNEFTCQERQIQIASSDNVRAESSRGDWRDGVARDYFEMRISLLFLEATPAAWRGTGTAWHGNFSPRSLACLSQHSWAMRLESVEGAVLPLFHAICNLESLGHPLESWGNFPTNFEAAGDFVLHYFFKPFFTSSSTSMLSN